MSRRRDRVACWDDLWIALRADRSDGPTCLGPAGTRAALRQAIDRARKAGELGVSGHLADSAGLRRRLARRFAPWMRAGIAPDDLPPPAGPVEAEVRRVYRRYQEVMADLGAVDEAGLAAFCSALFSLTQELPRSWGRVERLVIVRPPAEDRAVRLVLETLRKTIRHLRVYLPFEAEPARAELYAPAARLRECLLGRGFVERVVEPPADRPAGLGALGRTIFRDDAAPDAITEVDGLALLGAPRGEGLARVAADWIRRRIDLGEPPEELLILVRGWTEEAVIGVEALRGWGLPVSTGAGRPIGTDAAVQALRLAMAIPADDWDTDRLGRLLRNGRLRPDWPEAREHPLTLATTAAAIREARVYRGLDAIRNGARSPRRRRPRAGRRQARLLPPTPPAARLDGRDRPAGRRPAGRAGPGRRPPRFLGRAGRPARPARGRPRARPRRRPGARAPVQRPRRSRPRPRRRRPRRRADLLGRLRGRGRLAGRRPPAAARRPAGRCRPDRHRRRGGRLPGPPRPADAPRRGDLPRPRLRRPGRRAGRRPRRADGRRPAATGRRRAGSSACRSTRPRSAPRSRPRSAARWPASSGSSPRPRRR